MKTTATRYLYPFILIFHFSLFTLHSSFTFSQIPTVQDCLGAIPICQDTYVEENAYSGSGNYPNEIFNPSGDCTNDCPGSCLDGEQNSVWYIFTVRVAGNLRLTIDPLGNDDYDWAVYDLTEFQCPDIYTSYSLMQKSCNAYGQPPDGNTGISTTHGGTNDCNHCGGSGSNLWNKDLPVIEGRTYVLVIENWSGTNDGYTLDFSASTASIDDNVPPELDTVLTDEITCGDMEIIVEFSENVKCESVDPSDFLLAGPGGPYNILDVQGETCLIGGEMENRYSLIIDRPISFDGDYSMQLKPENYVYDACNNIAPGNTIVFNLDLGAPVIDDLGMNIVADTCSLSHGSITGLQIIGTPPYNYLWTDEQENPVGTTLDLLDVHGGNYYLLVTDENSCQTSEGPYFIDQTTAPQVDDTGIVITGANYGVNNGQITGLVVYGSEPLVYLWTDESNDTVGIELELHDVYSGNYYLLVTDIYGCDTVAGPYFVQQIADPLGVQIAAYPPEICAGDSSLLIATAFGGTGNYTFSWTSRPTGFTSTLQNPVVFPGQTTIYILEVTDGYQIIIDSILIYVHPDPVLYSTEGGGYICNGSAGAEISLDGSETDTDYELYRNATWTGLVAPGTGLPLSFGLQNQPGLYTVVASNNVTGCSAQMDGMAVIDYFIYGLPGEICMANVDSLTGKNMIIWEKSRDNAIASYNIYRESASGGSFDLLGNVDYSDLSVFNDNTSNPLQRSFSYGLTILDTCNNESSFGTIHTTMHLNINTGINSYNLIWTPYDGFNYQTYFIYRRQAPVGFQILDSVPNSITSYTDLNPPEGILDYVIGIRKENGCNPQKDNESYLSAFSNIISTNVGIEDQERWPGFISVFPNPNHGKFTLQLNKDVAGISIFDMIGNRLDSYSKDKIITGTLNMDLTHNGPGMYLIKATLDNGIVVTRFVTIYSQ